MDKAVEQQLKDHERRITKLENQREEDYEKLSKHNTDLATIVFELKSITKSMETLTENWDKAIKQNDEKQKEEMRDLNSRIEDLEKTIDILNEKLDKNTQNLEKEITEQTIGKNSEKWEKAKWQVFILILTAIVTFIIGRILP